MRRVLAGLVLVGLLVGCGQADVAQTESPATVSEGYAMGGTERGVREEAGEAAPAPAAPMDGAVGADADVVAPEQQNSPPSLPAGPTPTLFLAYSYQVGLELPAARLTGVMDRHVLACQTAGPRLCQLMGSNVSGDPESYISGYVSFRGEPAWLRSFMRGLNAEADAAGGRLKTQTTQSEDLTRAIVDTEARLRAQTALRDRLQELLRSRPGRLADLLEVERELARVQSEIDSVQSNLAVMRTRVAMSELTLSYQSSPKPLRGDTFRPLGDALAGFLGVVVMGFAAIITIIAGLLPFAIVLIPLVWGLLRWRRSRGGRFFGGKTPKSDSA